MLCMLSTAQRPLLSSTPPRRQFTVDGGPLGLTTPEVVTPTPLTDSTISVSRQTIRRDVRAYDRLLQKLRSESLVSVDVLIISTTHVCRSQRPSDNAWETRARKQLRRSARSGGNAGTNAQKQLKRKLDYWTWGGILNHDISPANLRLLLINAEMYGTTKATIMTKYETKINNISLILHEWFVQHTSL